MALSLSREEDRYVLVILCVEQNKEKRHLLLTSWSEMSFLCESEEREREAVLSGEDSVIDQWSLQRPRPVSSPRC